MDPMQAAPPLQPDIHIRPAVFADAGPIARVRVATWRSAYAGILPAAFLDDMSVDEVRHNWEGILAAEGRQGYSYVADANPGGVCGFIIGGMARHFDPAYPAELYAIYLLPEFQRSGAGRRLVAELVARLLNDDMDAMQVWVLAENHPARRFYESLGGRPLYEKNLNLAGQVYREQAYGWEDIRPLAKP